VSPDRLRESDRVWRSIRAAAPALRRAGGGSIVNISSAAANAASPALAAYGVTKWATRGMTKRRLVMFLASESGRRESNPHDQLGRTAQDAAQLTDAR
jgi:hypothetical protein